MIRNLFYFSFDCFYHLIVVLYVAHPQDSSAEMATDASEFFASVETLRSNIETFELSDDSTSRPSSQLSLSKGEKL